MIHAVKGFGIVNTEVDDFLELSYFSMIQQMLAIWYLVSLPSLNPAWTSGSSWFTYCWSLTWENFEHYFASVRWMQLCCSLNIACTAFLWDWNINWPFPVLWPLLSFKASIGLESREACLYILAIPARKSWRKQMFLSLFFFITKMMVQLQA